MKNFLAICVVLLIVGYLFALFGGELGLLLFAVAVCAGLFALLLAQSEQLDRLEKKLDRLLEKEKAEDPDRTA